MNVYFLNFTKNHKSTAVPNLTGLTPVTMKLKTPCTLLSPVLEYQTTPSTQASWVSANYAYITEFNRYYYITNINFSGNLIILTLKVDVLASWKSAITASSQYVLRSASAWNGFIKDTKYPIKAADPTRLGSKAANPLQPPGTEITGMFVVGIVSSLASITGCVQYYALAYTDMISLMQQLFTLNTQWQGTGTDIADGLKKAITDPMQYVISAIWLPYVTTDFTLYPGMVTATHDVYVGYDKITLSGYAYGFNNGPSIEFTNLISISIPVHPQSGRGQYLNYAPFSRYYLSFYPFCGLIELDGTQFKGGSLYLVYTVDLRTGKGILNIACEYDGTGYTSYRAINPMRVLEAQVGVNIPVATIHTALPSSISEFITNTIVAAGSDFGGTQQSVTTLAETGGNWLKKIGAGLAIGAVGQSPIPQPEVVEDLMEYASNIDTDVNVADEVSNIATNSLAMKSTIEMIGSQGTMSFYYRQYLMFWGDFYPVADDDNTKNGRPCCQTKTLSTLSGFTMCDNPRISGSGMSLTEQLEIERLLAAGVYIDP